MNTDEGLPGGRFEQRLRHVLRQLQNLALWLAPPLLRTALALPFLRSGLTRWDGWLSLSASTQYLFEAQFKLHVLGAQFDFPAPGVFAPLVACAEIVLPIALILGLATRLVALALLFMTGVIQLVFPDGWANFHLYWASLAVALIALGGGPWSLDHVLKRCWLRRNRSHVA